MSPKALLALLACVTGLVACGAPEARSFEAAGKSVSIHIDQVARAASAAPPPAPMPVTLRVVVGGEIGRGAVGDGAFALLSPLFGEADGSLAMHAVPRKQGVVASGLSQAARARLGSVMIAAPRACDSADAATTATTARGQGLGVLGVDDTDAWRARVLAERSGKRVCALGWSSVGHTDGKGCAPPCADHAAAEPRTCRPATIAVVDDSRRTKERIEASIAAAKSAGCDALVAVVHEVESKHRSRARGQAQLAAEAGADAVVVRAASVPAPVEIVLTHDARRVPIFASVGTLGGEGAGWERVGMIADLRWMWAEGGGKQILFDWGYHLVLGEADTRVAPPRGKAKTKVQARRGVTSRLLDPRADQSLLDRLTAAPRGPADLLGDRCWIEGAHARCH